MVDLALYKQQFSDQPQQLVRASRAVEFLETMPCETEEDYRKAGEWLKQCKAITREFDDRRKSVTQPLNAAIKEINGWFRPVITAYDQAERILKSKVLEYQARQAQIRQQIAQQMAAQHAIRDVAGLMASAVVAQQTRPPILDGVSTRRTWRWRAINLGAVPLQYLTTNDAAITDAMRASLSATGGPPDIPGLEFSQGVNVAVR